MAVDEFTWVEQDDEFNLIFFYCCLCPLTMPFLEERTARIYRDGHRHNAYHRRRLELHG